MNRKQTFLYFLDQVLGILVMAAALFWSAGRMDWWPAWAAIGVWVLWFGGMDVILFRLHPGLLAERLSPPPGGKTWDKVLMSLLRLVQLARYILAGLDLHYGWTSGFPLAVQLAALAACLLCTALFLWALGSNAFFSQVVRIQSERGHAVAAGGPYRFIRHPGYAAMLLFEIVLSALFGSWAAILAGGVGALLLLVRTALEDRTLQAELPGYGEYARRVRFRLLPGIW